MLNKILVTLFFVVFSISSFGKKSHQERLIDLNNALTPDQKIEAYFQIIKGLVNKKQSDSSSYYIKSLRNYHTENNVVFTKKVESKIQYYEGVMFYHKGLFHKAQDLITKSLETSDSDSLEAQRFFFLALSHKKLGNYSQSVEYYIKASNYFKDTDNHYARIGVLINLSNVLSKTKQDTQALNYLSEALKSAEEHNITKLNRVIYTSMGNIFLEMGDYKVALDQFYESYNLATEEGNLQGKFYSLINIADAKRRLGDENDALNNLQSAILLLDTLDNAGLKEEAYWELGNFFAHVKNKKEAEFYLSQSLLLSDSSKNNLQKRKIYQSYQILYENIGYYQKSLDYYKEFQKINEEILSNEMNLKITQINAEYDWDRANDKLTILAKEKDLKESEYQLEKEKREKDQVRFKFLIGIGLLLLVLVFALAAIGIIRTKKNQVLKEKNEELEDKKTEIELQNHELEEVNQKLGTINKSLKSKNEKIESQKEELKAQRDLLNATHEQLKIRNKDVTDSIHYAQKIQQAMLNSSFHIEGAGVEHFTFYKPRNIVSGDFYWSNVVNNKLIVAIGDCTGHGVPGAFMSCLGISLLNEIIFGREITAPHTILEELRNSIIQLISTDKNADLQIGDGMDMAILSLDLETNLMRFSGAMNGLVVVSGEDLEEIKGDKNPIGQHIISNHKFTIIEKQLKPGDSIYATTDGYKDQFGGPKGKKLGKRKLHEKLLEISSLSVPVQKAEMISFYKNWRQYEEQVDDVCLFGMRLN
ncbi:MAG: hypothetical protein CMP67_01605 [Flavobacteriales bacterium]|nr:hypothetical protein [Flavobacteriales bacterium]